MQFEVCTWGGRDLRRVSSQEGSGSYLGMGTGYPEVFKVFLNPSRHILLQGPKFGHDCSHPCPLEFIMHYTSCHPTLHNLRYWQLW